MSAESLRLRRETRRKKILENSERRLNRLKNLPEDSNNGIAFGSGISIEKLESSPTRIEDKVEPLPSPYHSNDGEESVISNTEKFEAQCDEKEQSKTSKKYSLLLDYKFLSLIVYFRKSSCIILALVFRLYLQFIPSLLPTQSIFFPFALLQCLFYSIESLTPSTTEKKTSGYVGTALLLLGFSSQRVIPIFSAIKRYYRVLEDFYLYFFSFIVLHMLIGLFN